MFLLPNGPLTLYNLDWFFFFFLLISLNFIQSGSVTEIKDVFWRTDLKSHKKSIIRKTWQNIKWLSYIALWDTFTDGWYQAFVTKDSLLQKFDSVRNIGLVCTQTKTIKIMQKIIFSVFGKKKKPSSTFTVTLTSCFVILNTVNTQVELSIMDVVPMGAHRNSTTAPLRPTSKDTNVLQSNQAQTAPDCVIWL